MVSNRTAKKRRHQLKHKEKPYLDPAGKTNLKIGGGGNRDAIFRYSRPAAQKKPLGCAGGRTSLNSQALAIPQYKKKERRGGEISNKKRSGKKGKKRKKHGIFEVIAGGGGQRIVKRQSVAAKPAVGAMAEGRVQQKREKGGQEASETRLL